MSKTTVMKTLEAVLIGVASVLLQAAGLLVVLVDGFGLEVKSRAAAWGGLFVALVGRMLLPAMVDQGHGEDKAAGEPGGDQL